MKEYILTVKHDNGIAKIRTTADNEEKAKQLVMIAEGCPERAILRVRRAAYEKQYIPVPPKKYLELPFKEFVKAGILQDNLWNCKISNDERELSAKLDYDARDTEYPPVLILETVDEETIRKEFFNKNEFAEIVERLKQFSEHGHNYELPPID